MANLINIYSWFQYDFGKQNERYLMIMEFKNPFLA